MRLIAVLFLIFILFVSLSAQVKTDTLTYSHGDTTLKALLVYDRLLKSIRPGIVIFHENQGFSDHINERAAKFAELGYVILVADLFGQISKDESLKDFKSELMEKKGYLRARARLAYDILAEQKRVESSSGGQPI